MLTLHCIQKANSAAGAAILKAIGVDLSDLNVLLGLTCSPITVVGVGSGTECGGTTVSCTNGVVVSRFNNIPLRPSTDLVDRTASVSAVSPLLSKLVLWFGVGHRRRLRRRVPCISTMWTLN